MEIKATDGFAWWLIISSSIGTLVVIDISFPFIRKFVLAAIEKLK
jgi:hypothetical protein